MRPTSRSRVNKSRSVRSFRRQVSKTHPKNIANMPMRGGWRL